MASNNSNFHHAFGGGQDWQQQPQQQPQQEQASPEQPSRKGRKRSASAVESSAAANTDQDDDGAGSQAMVFPVKLHRMLTQIDEKANNDKDSTTSRSSNTPTSEDASIVSWQPHGRCFLVHDKDAFVQRFLPSYFRQSKWASFQRQLNIYGFQRLTAGRDRGAYYHDLFLRGHPELATRIHRMKLKGIGQGRHRTNAELEPNFYRMKPVGAGDHIDPAAIGMQPNASAAAVAYASGQASPAAATMAPAAAGTVNVLQLFGGGNPGGVQGAATSLPVIANGTDLSNIFFLTNGNELATLQNLGGTTMSAGGATAMRDASDSGRSQHQEGIQSAQHLTFLANLFNNANTNNITAVPGEANPSRTRGGSTEAQESNSDDLNQWSSSNLFGGNSNLALLQQNQDTNLLTTATLMQYMSDNNSPDGGGHSPPDPTSNPSSSSAGLSMSQSQWASVATAGLHAGEPANTAAASARGGSNLPTNNSNSDLVNTFRLDGPSLRRMSAAAMSTLLSSTNGNNPVNTSALTSNPFDSNPNLLLFSSLHQSRNSSNNLIEGSSSIDPPAALTASQALNRLAAAQQHPTTRDATSPTASIAAAPGPAPTPASQQLAFINAAAAAAAASAGGAANVAQASNNGQSGYLFGDLLSTRAATVGSQPTFLDSVYEPIPIKENANANHETTAVAGGSGQQHKLSPRSASANADPTQGGGGRSGFHHLPSDHHQ